MEPDADGYVNAPVFANIPGMTAVKDSWALRNLDGFKRVRAGRPQSATAMLATRRNGSGNSNNYPEPASNRADTDLRYTYDEMMGYEMDPYKVTSSPGMPEGVRVRPSTANDPSRYRPKSHMARTKFVDDDDLVAVGYTSPVKRIGTLTDKISIAPEDMNIPMKNRGNHGATIVSATARKPDLPYMEPALEGQVLTKTPRGISPHGKPKHRINNDILGDAAAMNGTTERIYGANGGNRENQVTTLNETAMNYMLDADNARVVEARRQELMKYQDETKRTCRFTAFFTEDRVWNVSAPIGNPTIETAVKRSLTIEYFVFDGTWSIFEKKLSNLGIDGGKFLKRGKIVKDDAVDGETLTIYDMVPGNEINILGKKITITGADEATYKFLEAHFGIHIREMEIGHPAEEREDLGAHYAFGFGGKTFPPRVDNTFPPTYEFYQRREQNMKTRRFLFNDARPMRFFCIEISNRDDNGTISHDFYVKWKNGGGEKNPFVITNDTRMAILTYYIQDYCLEISLGHWPGQEVKFTELPLVLKRSKIQKNWREATKGKNEPVFFEPHDFVCGEIADIYGRYYLLMGCDDSTRTRYLDMGHDQTTISVSLEKVVPIERPIPKAGDGFLDIGRPEDTLATVYGQKKKTTSDPDKERHKGRVLKCLARLVSTKPTDAGRKFNFIFFMEDNTLSIFEEEVRNSGVVGGTFLVRGRWTNHLPPEGGNPRYFKANDVFLGNIVSVNHVEFQVTELDGASLRFCEKNPDEFPMSDTFEILMKLLDSVVDNAINVRKICQGFDPRKKGYLSKSKFVDLLDAICVGGTAQIPKMQHCLVGGDDNMSQTSSVMNPSIASDNIRRLLNDHELVTILRRFHQEGTELYQYDELCDMFSNLYFCRENGKGAPAFGITVNNINELTEAMRSSNVQWRRVFRKDVNAVHGTMIADHAIALFKKLGIRLSAEVIEYLSKKYAIAEDKAKIVVQYLNRKVENTGHHGYKKGEGISMGASVISMSANSTSTILSTSSKASVVSSSKGTLRKGNTLAAKKTATGQLGSALDEMSVASVTVEGRRRQLQETLPGIVRQAKYKMKAKETVVKLDLGTTVFNFQRIFDYVFISEWAFE
jgi:hypothetical protein